MGQQPDARFRPLRLVVVPPVRREPAAQREREHFPPVRPVVVGPDRRFEELPQGQLGGVLPQPHRLPAQSAREVGVRCRRFRRRSLAPGFRRDRPAEFAFESPEQRRVGRADLLDRPPQAGRVLGAVRSPSRRRGHAERLREVAEDQVARVPGGQQLVAHAAGLAADPPRLPGERGQAGGAADEPAGDREQPLVVPGGVRDAEGAADRAQHLPLGRPEPQRPECEGLRAADEALERLDAGVRDEQPVLVERDAVAEHPEVEREEHRERPGAQPERRRLQPGHEVGERPRRLGGLPHELRDRLPDRLPGRCGRRIQPERSAAPPPVEAPRLDQRAVHAELRREAPDPQPFVSAPGDDALDQVPPARGGGGRQHAAVQQLVAQRRRLGVLPVAELGEARLERPRPGRLRRFGAGEEPTPAGRVEDMAGEAERRPGRLLEPPPRRVLAFGGFPAGGFVAGEFGDPFPHPLPGLHLVEGRAERLGLPRDRHHHRPAPRPLAEETRSPAVVVRRPPSAGLPRFGRREVPEDEEQDPVGRGGFGERFVEGVRRREAGLEPAERPGADAVLAGHRRPGFADAAEPLVERRGFPLGERLRQRVVEVEVGAFPEPVGRAVPPPERDGLPGETGERRANRLRGAVVQRGLEGLPVRAQPDGVPVEREQADGLDQVGGERRRVRRHPVERPGDEPEAAGVGAGEGGGAERFHRVVVEPGQPEEGRRGGRRGRRRERFLVEEPAEAVGLVAGQEGEQRALVLRRLAAEERPEHQRRRRMERGAGGHAGRRGGRAAAPPVERLGEGGGARRVGVVRGVLLRGAAQRGGDQVEDLVVGEGEGEVLEPPLDLLPLGAAAGGGAGAGQVVGETRVERADQQRRPFAPRRGFRELLEEEDVLGVLAGGEFEVLAEFVEDEQQPSGALGGGFGEERRALGAGRRGAPGQGQRPPADRGEAGRRE